MDSRTILKDVFGYDNFRLDQEHIINEILNGKDVLAIMPTGGGKSICYQIPALVKDGLTIVISPLIALMNDQVAALRELNIEAAALHSNVTSEDSKKIFKQIESYSLKLLYLSPERLLSSSMLEYLKTLNISLIAIDEAHCVSVWGNDFRPEYVKLAVLKTAFPDVNTLALTATADRVTQEDINKQLKLRDAAIFVSSFERKNIEISVKSGIKRAEQIQAFLFKRQDTFGIIYCLSRKSTEQMAKKLSLNGHKVAAYHAGIEADERNRIQTAFQNDELNIVCATIAFGMGIDKPNINWVIHYNMPKNLEGYYQEIGRAGRDGQNAEALLFYSWADYLNLKKFIDISDATLEFKSVQTSKLERMWQFASGLSCRTNMILSYFGEYAKIGCQRCDNCTEPPVLFDGTRYTQMALSAIARSKESVGLNLLIDVLRGSHKFEIRKMGLHLIKTFGVGRDLTYRQWRHYITQMINQGLIAIDFTDYSKLKMTPLSVEVLKSKMTIQIGEYIEQKKEKKVIIPKLSIDTTNLDETLLTTLKKWRNQMARKQKVPVYIILNNKALDQIASLKPDNIQGLLAVDGIGKVKMEKYGDAILKIVQDNNN